MTSVAILGTGQAALALGAFIQLRNRKVYFYNDRLHQGCFRAVGKEFRLKGKYQFTCSLNYLTDDLKHICDECQLIFIVSPTYAHQRYYSLLKNYVGKNHFIFNITGNFTSLFARSFLNRDDISITDISISPFACRLEHDKAINLIGVKKAIHYSCLDPSQNDKVKSIIADFFPSELLECNSVVESGLNNMNGICHPAIMLLNAGRIGNGNLPFYFNKEGVNANVANVLEALEKERQAIAQAYFGHATSFLSIMEQFYGERYEDLLSFFLHSETLNAFKLCPPGVGGRYMEEDVGCLLSSWKSLADCKNIKTPTIDSIIHLSSLLVSKNFFEHGRKISPTLLI